MYVPELDRWISAEFSRLAEIIQDYNIDGANLELRWIPPDQRTEEDKKPYVVWDNNANVPVLFASELDTPIEILAKLFDIDNRNGDVLKRMHAHNAAQRAFQLKEEMDRMEQAHDFSAFVLANKKSVWKHDGQKYDEEFRKLGTGKQVIT